MLNNFKILSYIIIINKRIHLMYAFKVIIHYNKFFIET